MKRRLVAVDDYELVKAHGAGDEPILMLSLRSRVAQLVQLASFEDRVDALKSALDLRGWSVVGSVQSW